MSGGEGFTIGPLVMQVEGDRLQVIAEGIVGGQTIDGFAHPAYRWKITSGSGRSGRWCTADRPAEG